MAKKVDRSRINTLPATSTLNGLLELAEIDPVAPTLVQAISAAMASDFNSKISPDEYVQENSILWREAHRLLLPQASDPLIAPLPYPFLSFFDELTEIDGRQGKAFPKQLLSKGLATVSVQDVVGAAKGVISGSNIDPDTPLADAGLDSLAATSLNSLLQDIVKTDLPATLLFDAPTPRHITVALSGAVDTTPVSHGGAHGPEMVEAEGATKGWVVSTRLSGLLDSTFSTTWWAVELPRSQASEFYAKHSSLRTSFARSNHIMSNQTMWKWEWKVTNGALPTQDASCKTLDFADRAMPIFYETSGGRLWLNHAVWDAFSTAILMVGGVATRHFSVYAKRVSSMLQEWEEGESSVNTLVDRVLRGPQLFGEASPYIFTKRRCHLPPILVQFAKECQQRHSEPLESVWPAIVMVTALDCMRRSSAGVWLQLANRDAENRDIFGYITTEVGFNIVVNAEASFEARLTQCLEIFSSVTPRCRALFPEIAAGHPAFEDFLKCSLGINLVGSAMDDTDRSFIRRALGSDNEMIWGAMNWIEIGNEHNEQIAFYGRPDIVEFCSDELLPALLRHTT